jgi:hypothetical protein
MTAPTTSVPPKITLDQRAPSRHDNANAGERRLDFGDVDDRLGKGLWGFLRQVVPHAARDEPMLIFTREFAAISPGFRMGRAIGVAFEGDGGRGDAPTFGEPLFQIVIFRLASGQSEPPAIIVDHDRDMIRVFERRRRAIERGVIEVPLRRRELPISFAKSCRYLS